MFNPEKVADARWQLAEAERIKKEIEMYGGVLGSKGEEAPPKQSPEASEDNGTEYDGVSSANVLGRSTLMQTSRLSNNIIKNLRSLRYEVLSTNMHWKVNS